MQDRSAQVVELLKLHGPQTIGQLCERWSTPISRQVMNRRVRRLEKQGVVKRVGNAATFSRGRQPIIFAIASKRVKLDVVTIEQVKKACKVKAGTTWAAKNNPSRIVTVDEIFKLPDGRRGARLSDGRLVYEETLIRIYTEVKENHGTTAE